MSSPRARVHGSHIAGYRRRLDQDVVVDDGRGIEDRALTQAGLAWLLGLRERVRGARRRIGGDSRIPGRHRLAAYLPSVLPIVRPVDRSGGRQ